MNMGPVKLSLLIQGKPFGLDMLCWLTSNTRSSSVNSPAVQKTVSNCLQNTVFRFVKGGELFKGPLQALSLTLVESSLLSQLINDLYFLSSSISRIPGFCSFIYDRVHFGYIIDAAVFEPLL